MRALWIVSLVALAACTSEGNELDLPLDPATGLRIAALPPLPPPPNWDDNPATPEKKELGRTLFSDMRMSGSEFAVCANCHLTTTFFQSSTPTDVPDRVYPELGPALHRNAPSLLNVVYAPMLRWDGSHFTDLYDAMVLPFAEANMNLSGLPPEAGEQVDIPGAQEVMFERVTVQIPGYVDMFQDAFGVDIRTATPAEVWRYAGMALAVYLRVAVSRDSAFDAWNAGDDGAIDDAAKRGAVLFSGKANCIACHSGPLLSDFEFHNISTSPPDANGNRADEGRFLVTGIEADRGAFLTPMLRGSSKTSPYFHTGLLVGIRDAIRHKNSPAGRADPLHDPIIATLPALTDDEMTDIVEFIKALDGAPIPAADLAGPMSYPQ